jgi:hypothetical protein
MEDVWKKGIPPPWLLRRSFARSSAGIVDIRGGVRRDAGFLGMRGGERSVFSTASPDFVPQEEAPFGAFDFESAEERARRGESVS